jgi:prophage tail gpP-like protein
MALRVRGKKLGGWTQAGVTLSLKQAAATFSATTSEKSPDDPEGRDIFRGDDVEVEIQGEQVLAGYVDTVTPSYDSDQHRITFSGREKTGDLVDCSVQTPREFSSVRVDTIARALAAPYGISIGVGAGVDVGGVFTRFKVEPSDTVFAAIERAARHRGLLVTSDGLGTLVLTRGGIDTIGGVLGSGRFRILSAEAADSDKERFSDYKVISQQPAINPLIAGVTAAAPLGRAEDEGVSRYRLKTVVAGEPGSSGDLRERARWEASSRIGRGLAVKYTVRGWHAAPGILWRPNRRIRVEDDWLGVKTTLVIVTVGFVLDSTGRKTALELQPPEALDVQVLKERQATPELFGDG